MRPESDHVAAMGVLGDKRGDFSGLLHLGGTVTRLNMYPRPIQSVLQNPVS
jgi:hypothetical protein